MKIMLRVAMVTVLATVLLFGVIGSASAIGPGDSNLRGELAANEATGEPTDTHPGVAERCLAIGEVLESPVFDTLDPDLKAAFEKFFEEECL